MSNPQQQEPSEDDLLRRALFVPCESKEALHQWIQIYLGLNLPDTVVDEESNSSPMDIIWEIYKKALDNNDENFSRVMVYASRDSFKTLGAAILEVLAVVHLDRDVAHMAAIKEQAKKAQSYVKKFFRLPYLREFVTSANTEKTEVLWYHNPKSGECLPRDRFEAIQDPAEKNKFVEHSRYIKIVICTMQGANCVDPATKITMADGSQKQALEVRVGDRVRSYHVGSRKFTETVVGEVGVRRKPRMRVHFDDGGSVVVSDDHLVFTRQGWRHARALKVGALCFAASEAAGSCDSSTEMWGEEPEGDPRQVLLGTLLGDASLTWPRQRGRKYGRGPRFQVTHSLAQEGYLRRKLRLLEPLIGRCRLYRTGGRIKAISRTLPDLAPLYEALYPGDRKTISREVLSSLMLEGVAYWFMDDGAGCPEQVGSAKDHSMTLATCCFSEDEQRLAVERLLELGIHATLSTASNSSGKTYPVLALSLDESRALSSLVDVYLSADVKYKFPAPVLLTEGRCIECGCRTPPPENGGFSRCDKHPYLSNSRRFRREQAEFSRQFTKKITKLEHLEPAALVDIHIATEDEHLRNFVANSAYLLHNSEHVPFFVVDEVDVVPKQNQAAYQEAKSIPAMFEGKEPITLLTSTRKFAFGNVQRELDASDKTGLVVRHWNIIDVTQRCPPERHLPNQPRITIWINKEDLSSISDEDYQKLAPEKRVKFESTQGPAGCLRNCKLFTMCRGRLATQQKDHPKDAKGNFIAKPAPLLKSIKFTTNKFRELTLDMAKAQLLCWKASQEGLIYAFLDREKHVQTPAQIAEKLLGEGQDPSMTFEALIQLMRNRSGKWVVGIDFGFTHNFAVVLLYVDGARAFVVGHWAQPELDPAEKLDLLERTIREFDPMIYADPEAPDMIKFIKKHGYRCKDWTKGPGSVLSGIETVRYKLTPGIASPPQLFFVDGGPGVKELVDQLALYHWALDQNGNVSNEPDEIVSQTDEGEKILDDSCDALRYVIMNVFGNRGRVIAAQEEPIKIPTPTQVKSMQEANRVQQKAWAAQIMNHVMSPSDDPLAAETPATETSKGRKGGFVWDMS